MKSIQTIRTLMLLAALAAGMASCQKEELPTVGEIPQGAQLTISVTDGGYATTSHTRATDNGYTTTFATGDQIGLYVVKADGKIISNNICLTHSDTGWMGNAYYGGAGARYFAYYPYQPTLAGELVPTATIATAFFSNAVSAWTPATDQSTPALYTASDLMIGSGTLGSKQPDGTYPLSFIMTHAMALVVIETPTAKYTLATDNNYTWTTEAPDTKFTDFTPYSTSLSVYRYLVKPSQGTTLYGSYTNSSSKTQKYTLNANITAANYRCYKVDAGTTTIVTRAHTLQIGDFYLSDGSLVGKGKTLTTEQQAACVGIVLKVGRDGSGDWIDDCTYTRKDGITSMPTIHGYVLALHDANGGNDCTWGELESFGNVDGYGGSVQGFRGYKYTANILKDDINSFHAVRHTTSGYERIYAAPNNSSGWFLPSFSQMLYWFNNKATLLESVRKVMNNPTFSWQGSYWSSEEFYQSTGDNAYYLDLGVGEIRWAFKGISYKVHSLLAF